MSSFVRRIQRQVSPSVPFLTGYDKRGNPQFTRHPARRKFYMGRGSKLGVSNPKDKALLARLAREARHSKGAK